MSTKFYETSISIIVCSYCIWNTVLHEFSICSSINNASYTLSELEYPRCVHECVCVYISFVPWKYFSQTFKEIPSPSFKNSTYLSMVDRRSQRKFSNGRRKGGPRCFVMVGCFLVYASNTWDAATFFCRHKYLQGKMEINNHGNITRAKEYYHNMFSSSAVRTMTLKGWVKITSPRSHHIAIMDVP